MGVKKAVLCGYPPRFASVLGKSLESSGFMPEITDSLDPSQIAAKGADVVFCSLSGPVREEEYASLLEGIQVLRIARVDMPILCTSPDGDLDRIVQAVRAGASDYERWEGPNGAVPRRLLRLAEDYVPAPRPAEEGEGFQGILGKSHEIRRVFDLITKVAGTSSTILLHGESGTGKELVCRAIHRLSKRRKSSLIPVNCGAIPEELLESELFGHEKGAFTGATTSREGRFQMADGGTIFLDEVTEMSPKLQVKLLRVLQESEFERVGGAKTIRVDVRIVAATNRDLEGAVAEKKFREDLFYRLNVIPIQLPPLRARREDIPLLLNAFIQRYREKESSHLKWVGPDALAALQAYAWPGNVRELENFIERMAILAERPELRLEDLPERFRGAHGGRGDAQGAGEMDIPNEGIDLKAVIDDIETRLIQRALERAGGVKNRAAQLLGLNRTTLVEKLKKKNFEAANGER